MSESPGYCIVDLPMFMYFLCYGMGIMFATFHVWGMMLLFYAMVYMLVRYVTVCESKRSYLFLVTDVQFVLICGVVLFTMFYCLLDLSCCECNVL